MTQEPAAKGRLIEDLVQRLHAGTELSVQARVRLPTIRNPKHYREFDVLATGQMLGRPMHLAFECKNYGKRIGVPKVDEFRGKLEAVGIPVQHGIMIASANGYTSDALARASELGISLLVLDGLTDDRLATVAYQAFQSVVYILLFIKKIAITNGVPKASWDDLLFLRDVYGNLQGSVMDLVWAQWRDGHIPLTLGEYDLSLGIPRSWHWLVDGTDTPSTVAVKVQTVAYVHTVAGQAMRVTLRDAATGRLDRTHLSATFPEEVSGTLALVRANTEDELQTLLETPSKVHLTFQRIPLPRIAYDMFWPPSERAIARLDRHFRDLIRAGKYDVEQYKLRFREIEGGDLGRIWDPIWSAHPASRDQAWPWPAPRRTRPSRTITTRPREILKLRKG